MSNGTTALMRGLAETGKYYVSRKAEKRKREHELELEAIRQHAWRKRLQEQADEQRRLKGMLLEKERMEQKRKQEETYLDILKEGYLKGDTRAATELSKRLNLPETLSIPKEYLKKREPIPKTTSDPRLKQLQSLRLLKRGYEGKYDEKTGEYVGRDEARLKHINKLIDKLTEDITDVSFEKKPEMSQQEFLDYYDSLLKGGFETEQARRLMQQRFAPDQKDIPSPKQPTTKENWRNYLNR